jgi:sulfite exporter TauE/SafE
LDHLGSAPLYMAPLLAFSFGAMSSIHCVGMCGGLIYAVAPQRQNQIVYHVMRLIGYLSVAGLFIFTGLGPEGALPQLKNIAVVIMGGLFIYLGLKKIFGWKLDLFSKLTGGIFSKLSNQSLFKFAMSKKNKNIRAGLVGLLSVSLPCGVLYTMMIALIALESPMVAILGVGGFWLGTLPVLFMGQGIIMDKLKQLLNRVPRLSGGLILVIGVATLYYRLTPQSCH